MVEANKPVENRYCDELRAPLIIHHLQDPHGWRYEVDDDSTVITLSDWDHAVSTELQCKPYVLPFPALHLRYLYL